ncbi:hypothetical protein [Rhizobium sp. Root1220]|uniref:hypothetical protein n=1 Tax=Rhizobium sp. Root1220 TaxID=1736432 RepID=UPI0006FC6402|nr:hypothetical protein [Rhizobium sp. Root1220]KQV83254.1 hypothetical protein ASC90_21925 [Rhizobium sp. Root1220]
MRGGPRKGAGRPRGAATKRTREIADKASADGLTPLEVMLKAMRAHAEKNDWDAAASIAKDAAPYMHAKLASVQHTGRGGGPIQTVDLTNVSDEQLNALEAIFGPLAGASGDDEGDPGGEGEA